MSDAGSLRALVVDDHFVVRRGVVAYLDAIDWVSVAGEAADGAEAIEKLRALERGGLLPGVVLMDLRMPRMDGVAATAEISRLFPGVRVVILTSFGESERVRAALSEGACGYVLKDAGPDEISAALHAAARDEVFIDPAVGRRLAQQIRSPRAGLGGLTAREREILVLLARGRSNKAIAAELVISERTARTHVSNLLAKLNLTSRTQAALVAVREGLVEPG